eukprot:TRINITY_DN45792_c0_g1_i1.p1 TRINITY_DN45792_c0_g1~~TRINITY_DN45792_c0_g1_i1.p1  ORF type:complete len:283 (+),score=100.32 TRINITY_DN45792_c0_g1_i1:105-851(+)
MEDFSKIGLLDFQSRGGQHTSFPSQAHNTGLRLTTDFSTYQVGQTSNFSQKEVASGRGHQAASSTWNLEELMTDLALVYVSGDGERLEGDKLQFCTSTCCNSRVKYARVCREKETSSSPWDRDTTTSTWDIPRQVPHSWDLGSDGASTPGSGYNCWSTNTQDSLGVVGTGRVGQLWAGTEFATIQPSQEYQEQHTLLENHFFEDPEKFDSWAGCEAVLGGQVGTMEGGLENKWNRIKRKSKKTKAATK